MPQESIRKATIILSMALPQFLAGYQDGREYCLMNPMNQIPNDVQFLALLRKVYEEYGDDPPTFRYQIGMLFGKMSTHDLPVKDDEFADEEERRNFRIHELLGLFGETEAGQIFKQYILAGWSLYEGLERTAQRFREKAGELEGRKGQDA